MRIGGSHSRSSDLEILTRSSEKSCASSGSSIVPLRSVSILEKTERSSWRSSGDPTTAEEEEALASMEEKKEMLTRFSRNAFLRASAILCFCCSRALALSTW